MLNTDKCFFCGLCQGISDFTKIPVIIFRWIFLILFFVIPYFAGCLLYPLLSLILPKKSSCENIKHNKRAIGLLISPIIGILVLMILGRLILELHKGIMLEPFQRYMLAGILVLLCVLSLKLVMICYRKISNQKIKITNIIKVLFNRYDYE